MKTAAKKLKPAGIKIVQRKPVITDRLAHAISAVRELNGEEIKLLEVYLTEGRDTKALRDVRDAIRKLPKDIRKTIRDLVLAHASALYLDRPADEAIDDEKINHTYHDLYSVLNHEDYSLYSRGDDPKLDAMLDSASVA